jgi:uncharacterized membrane protein
MRYTGLLVLLLSIVTVAQQQAGESQTSAVLGTFIKFNVGGTTATRANSINAAGTVAGYYFHPRKRGIPPLHGFLRHLNGTVTTFSVPGATESELGTLPVSINRAGAVTGVFVTGDPRMDNVEKHGFLRQPNGTITGFDVPGSKGSDIGTSPVSINDAGEIAGVYENRDVDFRRHGFLRAPDGTISTFDGPTMFDTVPTDINRAGTITGWWDDAFGFHGFLRSRDGIFTSFDVPPSIIVPAPIRTSATSINAAGAVTGNYANETDFIRHGFVRAPDATFTTFDVPGAVNTFPNSINPAGTIVGSYDDLNRQDHGFVRFSDGTITKFDGPEATRTILYDINAAGVVTGFWEDVHGDFGLLLILGHQ